MTMTNTFVERLISSIPDKPVDGFKVKFYRLHINTQFVNIGVMEYVYYVNTPWDVYDPTRKGGADLVDDWMLNKDGYCEGRVCGWKHIRAFLQEQKSTTFEFKIDALHEAIKRLDKWIAQDEAKILQMRELRAEQVSKIKSG